MPLCILCKDSLSTVWIVNDGVKIKNLGPGDQIIWNVNCGSNLIRTENNDHLNYTQYTIHPVVKHLLFIRLSK